MRRQAPTVTCTEKTRTETHGAHVSEKFCTAARSRKTSKGGAGTAAVRAGAGGAGGSHCHNQRQTIHGCDIGNICASAALARFFPPTARTNGTSTKLTDWAGAALNKRPTAPLHGASARARLSAHVDTVSLIAATGSRCTSQAPAYGSASSAGVGLGVEPGHCRRICRRRALSGICMGASGCP